jgi:hypothetical protein
MITGGFASAHENKATGIVLQLINHVAVNFGVG